MSLFKKSCTDCGIRKIFTKHSLTLGFTLLTYSAWVVIVNQAPKVEISKSTLLLQYNRSQFACALFYGKVRDELDSNGDEM